MSVLTRKEALAIGLSFPKTYQDAPFHDPNWQLVRFKPNKKAFLWTYEKDGHICLNVNFPKVPVEEIKGIRITRQCHATWHEDLQERTDPYGRKYYWLTGWL